jgi:hypothetical protein
MREHKQIQSEQKERGNRKREWNGHESRNRKVRKDQIENEREVREQKRWKQIEK